MIVTDNLAKRLREKMKRLEQAKQLEAPLRAVRPVVQARHVTPQAPPVAAQLPPPEPVSAPAPAVRPLPPSSPSGGGGGGSWGAAPQQDAPVAKLVKRGGVGGGTGSANRVITEANNPYNTFYNPTEEEQMNRPQSAGGRAVGRASRRFEQEVLPAATQFSYTLDKFGVPHDLGLGNVPVAGNVLGPAAELLTENVGPVDLLVAGVGANVGLGLTPLLEGNFARRAAGEAAINFGARGGYEAAKALDAPMPVQIAAGLAGGVAGGAGATRASEVLPGIGASSAFAAS